MKAPADAQDDLRILVTFAVPEEAAPFRRLCPPGVKILVTGMGADAAGRNVEAEFERSGNYDLVISCGFCGGLDSQLKRETVVVAVDSDAEVVALAAMEGICSGTFHCAESVATTGGMKARLRAETGADVVEMESGIIAGICRSRGIRVATLRVISDEAGEDLPLDFNKLMTRRGGIHFGKLAIELARRPRMIPELMRLQKRTARAASALAERLGGLIGRLQSIE